MSNTATTPAAAAAHAIVTDVAADNALAARMIHPRADVASALRVAMTKGAEIRATRIRYQEDLDEARALKLKWTQALTDLLSALFDNSSVADYCNDWVGKIFPEYAELGNFVEQFYEEMDHRLAKLKSVLERVDQVSSTLTPAGSAAPSAPTVNPMPVLAPGAPVAEAPKAAVVAVAPNAAGVVSHETPAAPSSVVLLGVAESDPACGAVAALLKRLNVAGRPAADPLAAGATDAAVYVVPSQPSDPSQARVALFELGRAVGRLGANRVCVLHPVGDAPFADTGIVHIPADPGGGWQLQLARHLKQAGVNVDLNKLF